MMQQSTKMNYFSLQEPETTAIDCMSESLKRMLVAWDLFTPKLLLDNGFIVISDLFDAMNTILMNKGVNNYGYNNFLTNCPANVLKYIQQLVSIVSDYDAMNDTNAKILLQYINKVLNNNSPSKNDYQTYEQIFLNILSHIHSDLESIISDCPRFVEILSRDTIETLLNDGNLISSIDLELLFIGANNFDIAFFIHKINSSNDASYGQKYLLKIILKLLAIDTDSYADISSYLQNCIEMIPDISTIRQRALVLSIMLISYHSETTAFIDSLNLGMLDEEHILIFKIISVICVGRHFYARSFFNDHMKSFSDPFYQLMDSILLHVSPNSDILPMTMDFIKYCGFVMASTTRGYVIEPCKKGEGPFTESLRIFTCDSDYETYLKIAKDIIDRIKSDDNLNTTDSV